VLVYFVVQNKPLVEEVNRRRDHLLRVTDHYMHTIFILSVLAPSAFAGIGASTPSHSSILDERQVNFTGRRQCMFVVSCKIVDLYENKNGRVRDN
jgi:hypothetical protein